MTWLLFEWLNWSLIRIDSRRGGGVNECADGRIKDEWLNNRMDKLLWCITERLHQEKKTNVHNEKLGYKGTNRVQPSVRNKQDKQCRRRKDTKCTDQNLCSFRVSAHGKQLTKSTEIQ